LKSSNNISRLAKFLKDSVVNFSIIAVVSGWHREEGTVDIFKERYELIFDE